MYGRGFSEKLLLFVIGEVGGLVLEAIFRKAFHRCLFCNIRQIPLGGHGFIEAFARQCRQSPSRKRLGHSIFVFGCARTYICHCIDCAADKKIQLLPHPLSQHKYLKPRQQNGPKNEILFLVRDQNC